MAILGRWINEFYYGPWWRRGTSQWFKDHGSNVNLIKEYQSPMGLKSTETPTLKRKFITLAVADSSPIGPIRKNFNGILIKIQIQTFLRIGHLKKSYAKWDPFCFCFSVLKNLTKRWCPDTAIAKGALIKCGSGRLRARINFNTSMDK